MSASLSTLSDSVDSSLLNIFLSAQILIRLFVQINGHPVLFMSISASDGDGDAIIYTITSSNFDLDADGNPHFLVSANGALSINNI